MRRCEILDNPEPVQKPRGDEIELGVIAVVIETCCFSCAGLRTGFGVFPIHKP